MNFNLPSNSKIEAPEIYIQDDGRIIWWESYKVYITKDNILKVANKELNRIQFVAPNYQGINESFTKNDTQSGLLEAYCKPGTIDDCLLLFFDVSRKAMIVI